MTIRHNYTSVIQAQLKECTHMSIVKRLVLVLLGFAILVAGTACSIAAPDGSEIAVHQENYVLIPSDVKVDECVNSNTTSTTDAGDNFFYYPAQERTYKFSMDPDSDGGPVNIVKGNVPLVITGVVSFFLNTDCETLKAFHNKIGMKQWGPDKKYAYIQKDGEDVDYTGWNAMLDTYIEQSIQSAATAASNQIKADYLSVYNGAGRGELEGAMRALLPVYVKQLSGGEFFKDFNLVVNKPTIENQNILDAIASKTVAQLQNEAQQQKNAAVKTELESIRELVAVLGQQGYIDYTKNQLTKQQLDLISQAIAKGNIQILPIPQGSNVTVGAK